MPRSSSTVWALNDLAGQQELRPRSRSGAFENFEQEFQYANLPKGQSCFEDKMQDLNIDFEICISPRPSGIPMAKAPLSVIKEFEHQEGKSLLPYLPSCFH